MPNQLSDTKVRKSITEYKIVIDILNKIAKEENRTFMDLIRDSIRTKIKEHITHFSNPNELQDIINKWTPVAPKEIKTAADLSKFKKEQRKFDEILLELDLLTPQKVAEKNSFIPVDKKIRILEFE